MIRKVGEVAYELELPIGSKINNVFHVSCLNKVIIQHISVSDTLPSLKKVIGKHISVSDTLPPLDDEGQLVLIPNKILRTRERRLQSRTLKEYLVQWKYLTSEEANREDEQIL